MPNDKSDVIAKALSFQKEVASTGFDWPHSLPVLDKLKEEVEELISAIKTKDSSENIAEEYGDVLLVALNLANHLKLDPHTIIEQALTKFQHRFSAMVSLAKEKGLVFESLSLDEQEALWQQIKSYSSHKYNELKKRD